MRFTGHPRTPNHGAYADTHRLRALILRCEGKTIPALATPPLSRALTLAYSTIHQLAVHGFSLRSHCNGVPIQVALCHLRGVSCASATLPPLLSLPPSMHNLLTANHHGKHAVDACASLWPCFHMQNHALWNNGPSPPFLEKKHEMPSNCGGQAVWLTPAMVRELMKLQDHAWVFEPGAS